MMNERCCGKDGEGTSKNYLLQGGRPHDSRGMWFCHGIPLKDPSNCHSSDGGIEKSVPR